MTTTDPTATVATGRAPIAVALDTPDLATSLRLARAVGPFVSVVKIGLENYLRDGREAVEQVVVASGRPVFLDLKLHDIPNTVAGAARSVRELRPAYLTVHATGGTAMIKAAVDELPDTQVTGVTVLTSLSAADLDAVGLRGPASDAARRLAVLAVEAGATAVVCSPHEVSAIRSDVGPDITLITPGVRPAGADADDQSRTATPEQALADGADLLVIGRPITAADNPGLAARTLRDALAR